MWLATRSVNHSTSSCNFARSHLQPSINSRTLVQTKSNVQTFDLIKKSNTFASPLLQKPVQNFVNERFHQLISLKVIQQQRRYESSSKELPNDAGQVLQEKINRSMSNWLLFCAFLVFVMVIFGGLTRLTESGLSITEWKPITGTIPPLTQQDWEEEFAKYKNSPEYHRLNYGMSLEDFKKIFYMEWGHRELGRFIGLVYGVGLLWFGLRHRQLKGRRGMMLMGLLGLGGLQGAAGWFMVKSGLDPKTFDPENTNQVPRVTAPRLTIHLTLALILYGALLYQGLKLRGIGGVGVVTRPWKAWAHSNMALVFLTAVTGALVAGRDAGLVYKTFPTMDGEWIPSDILKLSPKSRNWLENDATIQFTHRVMAISTFTSILTMITCLLRSHKHWQQPYALGAPIPTTLKVLGGVASAQVALGISTLLAQDPIPFAASHQAGALTLLSVTIYLMRLLAKR